MRGAPRNSIQLEQGTIPFRYIKRHVESRKLLVNRRTGEVLCSESMAWPSCVHQARTRGSNSPNSVYSSVASRLHHSMVQLYDWPNTCGNELRLSNEKVIPLSDFGARFAKLSTPTSGRYMESRFHYCGSCRVQV